MYIKFAFFTISLFCSSLSFAGQNFFCGGAEVSIDVVKTSDVAVASVVTVKRGEALTILRHTKIDFIGGVCVKNKSGKDLILYQPICGGSACRDLDNWGIVDPVDLRVLLAPSDTNRTQAIDLLGSKPSYIENKLSIEKEKIRLGVRLF